MLKLLIKQGWQDAQHFRDRPLHTYIHEIAKCGGHYSEINALLKKILLYNEFIARWLLTIYGTLLCVVVFCAVRLRSKLIY